MTYARIKGTGSYLPKKILTNQDLEIMVDTSHEWIVERTGIERRHVSAKDESSVSMAIIAAKEALNTANILPEHIELIIVETATPDHFFPSAACMVQNALGITNECPAFDVSAACAGFIYGMSIANQYIRSGVIKTALVIGADSLTKLVDWSDRSTCILFGDGAAAVVLGADNKPGILSTHIHANGTYAGLLSATNGIKPQDQDHHIKMKGNAVFRVAVKTLDKIVGETLAANNMQKSDIDWLIPHQANLRIIKATAKKLDLPMSRVILGVEDQGNTSAASIPLALDQAVRAGKIQRNENLLMEAFGAGFTWGSALVKY